MSKKKVKAKARNRFFGDVLNVDAKTAEDAGLLTLLGAAAAGIVYGGWKILKNVIYAIPSLPSSQVFVITGYQRQMDSSLLLLGHCANRGKDQPKDGEDYELILDADFVPDNSDLHHSEIQKYFSRLYNDLDESLGSIITDEKTRHVAVLLGAQEGLWIISNEESLANCRKRLQELHLSGIVDNELILFVFEAISNAGVNLFGLSCAKDFFAINFDDPKLQQRLEKLRIQAISQVDIIGPKR